MKTNNVNKTMGFNQNETVNFSHLGHYLARCIDLYKRDCYGLKSEDICAATHISPKTLCDVKKGSNRNCNTIMP